MKKLEKPSVEQVPKYINMWTSKELENDRKVKECFKTYPENVNEEHILEKVRTLDRLYKTRVTCHISHVDFAKHILDLEIDPRLEKRNTDLVNDIANTPFAKHYVFATKYCNFHVPDVYPIYDSRVEQVLKYCKKHYQFHFNNLEELEDYPTFFRIMEKFREHYGLTEDFSVKEIDMYLWKAGMVHFYPVKK